MNSTARQKAIAMTNSIGRKNEALLIGLHPKGFEHNLLRCVSKAPTVHTWQLYDGRAKEGPTWSKQSSCFLLHLKKKDRILEVEWVIVIILCRYSVTAVYQECDQLYIESTGLSWIAKIVLTRSLIPITKAHCIFIEISISRDRWG